MTLKLKTELGRKITPEEMDDNFRHLETLLSVGGMELRTTSLTVFVHGTLGDDANDGLTEITPKKTIQAAVNVVSKYHHGTTVPVVKIGPGTYAEAIDLPNIISDVSLFKAYVEGDSGNMSDVIVDGSTGSIASCFRSAGSQGWCVRNMKLTNSNGNLLSAVNGGVLFYGNVDFGSSNAAHVYAASEGIVNVNAAYTISGNALRHFNAVFGGIIEMNNLTATILNTPSISQFARATINSTIYSTGATFAGLVNGQRYSSENNACIFVGGAGINYFPGNVAGTISNRGIYS